MAVRGSSDTVGDDALTAATGRASEEWFALLDAAGASGWRHGDIARGCTSSTASTPGGASR